jgi:hypothetical protein
MASKPDPIRKEEPNPALAKSAGDQARTQSYTRFKPPSQRVETALGDGGSAPQSHAPSTLPPAPFTNEADVAGHEWWLESHMGVAANILCFEQSLAGDDEHGKLGALAAKVGEVRDALYELYCDAADPRMEAIAVSQGTLAMYIASLYTWCDRVVDALLVQSIDVRRSALDLSAARDVVDARLFEDETQRSLRQAIANVDADFASPFEPLRNLPKDLEQMFAAAAALRDELLC